MNEQVLCFPAQHLHNILGHWSGILVGPEAEEYAKLLLDPSQLVYVDRTAAELVQPLCRCFAHALKLDCGGFSFSAGLVERSQPFAVRARDFPECFFDRAACFGGC